MLVEKLADHLEALGEYVDIDEAALFAVTLVLRAQYQWAQEIKGSAPHDILLNNLKLFAAENNIKLED